MAEDNQVAADIQVVEDNRLVEGGIQVAEVDIRVAEVDIQVEAEGARREEVGRLVPVRSAFGFARNQAFLLMIHFHF